MSGASMLASAMLALQPASAEPAAASAASSAQETQSVTRLVDDPFHIADGPREFHNRLSFSPAWGILGTERLYALRFAWNPNPWLGWEASIGHNPGRSVHALLHTLDAVLRRPLSGRVQPYVRAGYGMMLVYPGESFNADPVTANVLAAGGGVEMYLRDDLAIRTDARAIAALSGDARDEGTVAYRYGEFTIGLSFYRGLGE